MWGGGKGGVCMCWGKGGGEVAERGCVYEWGVSLSRQVVICV